MDSDFVFVNPNKIPPRRLVKKTLSSDRPGAYKASHGLPEKNLEDAPDFDFLSDSVYLAKESAASLPDPLTRSIWGEFSPPEPGISGALAPFSSDEPPPSPTASRAALLAELENIDKNDAELLRQIHRVSKPTRTSPLTFASARADFKNTRDNSDLKINVFKKESSLKGDRVDYYRAENDWFQVNLAAPERIDRLKKYARDRAEKNEDITDGFQPEESGLKFKTFLATLVLFFVSATVFFIYSRENNFLKSALAGLNSKLLSSASFTLVNTEENSMFPKLFEIRSQIKRSGVSDSAAQAISDFLEKNASFDWFNIFKKKGSGGGFTLVGFDSLEKAKNTITASAAAGIKDLNLQLEKQTLAFEFWNRIFLPEKKYLVVVTDEERPWPGAAKPQSYVVVNTIASGLEVINSAKISSLDAAFNLKIMPPEPVKVASTAWLPSESFWFLDFEDSAKTFINFFENTTSAKIDGIIVFSRSFLKDLSFKENLVFNIDSPNWFYGLTDAVSRKPAGRWVSLAQAMEKALYSNKVQFYFKDDFLEKFVLNSGWSSKVHVSQREDFLGVGWASIKDGSLGLDLVEYRSNVFEDGSVMARINILLRQDANGVGSQNYFKIYLPQGSQPLKAEGFSPRVKIPEFEYARQGFSADARIKPPEKSEIENLDVFEESGLTVVGGWINLKSADRSALSLEYLLPFKLDRKNTIASYHLRVARPHQNEDVPFRFVMTPEKNIKLISLDPDGFVSENLGEYQGNLSQNLQLQAGLRFDE